LLFCYEYDPSTGRYGVAILRLLRVAAVAKAAVVALGILRLPRSDVRTGKRPAPTGPPLPGPAGSKSIHSS
jgi:hypothetical protein